ncbi:hypothetical protein CHH62_08985 [Niallia circulans]|nr:hypothetical protein CHH62_08985 [Niallia circulans]
MKIKKNEFSFKHKREFVKRVIEELVIVDCETINIHLLTLYLIVMKNETSKTYIDKKEIKLQNAKALNTTLAKLKEFNPSKKNKDFVYPRNKQHI